MSNPENSQGPFCPQCGAPFTAKCEHLKSEGTHLADLPDLPEGMEPFSTKIKSLPKLPDSLKFIDVGKKEDSK